MSEGKAKAEALLRRAGYTDKQPTGYNTNHGDGKSAGRETFIAVEIEQSGKEAKPSKEAHIGADKDYFGNLKRFERKDDMSAEPTRSSGNEKSQK